MGNNITFEDRESAGRQLAKLLSMYAEIQDLIVLGIPRGGVPVAFEIAKALHAPLDIFPSHKLGVPGNEELAFGAVACGYGRFLDRTIIQTASISWEQIEEITDRTQKTLEEQARLYRGEHPALSVEDAIVILVDDGIATGSSIYAAIRALRPMHPKKLIVAVPVAPLSSCAWLRTEVDGLIVLSTPERFSAVGQFYDDFRQTSDQDVIELFKRNASHKNR
jgi:putative phosphoribosyl transferase